MDSRDVPSQPHLNLHTPSASMMINHNSYVHSNNRNPNAMIGPGSATGATSIHHSSAGLRLPFGSIAPPPLPPPASEPRAVESLGFEGSPSSTQSAMRFGLDQTKKKRGRPRKYVPDGKIALGLSTTSPLSAPLPASASNGSGGGGTNPNPNSSEPPPKRNRGRPPGSGKKQLDALGGMGGVGFTPHVIEVKAGEDIASKITDFSQQGPRAICVLSASGAISSVTLRQQASSGSIVTYEGRFDIISLSGSFLQSESDSTGSLSVSLAGQDGQILGGVVAGLLMAGSLVQVVVGSFVMNSRKQKSKDSQGLNPRNSAEPPKNMLSFGSSATAATATATATSPRSQPRHSSELSEEQDSGDGSSPLHRGGNHMFFGNTTQPIHPLQMYHPLWNGHNP